MWSVSFFWFFINTFSVEYAETLSKPFVGLLAEECKLYDSIKTILFVWVAWFSSISSTNGTSLGEDYLVDRTMDGGETGLNWFFNYSWSFSGLWVSFCPTHVVLVNMTVWTTGRSSWAGHIFRSLLEVQRLCSSLVIFCHLKRNHRSRPVWLSW